jgi:hypothetical protein
MVEEASPAGCNDPERPAVRGRRSPSKVAMIDSRPLGFTQGRGIVVMEPRTTIIGVSLLQVLLEGIKHMDTSTARIEEDAA